MATALNPDQKAIENAVIDLAAWATHHQTVLAVGRAYGFSISMTRSTKLALQTAGASPIALAHVRVVDEKPLVFNHWMPKSRLLNRILARIGGVFERE